jgi:CheY-like chemotaxis protein/HPt (histidine-containing phosphotransfer) domain-containing protein
MLGDLRILVADDSDANREIGLRLLTKLGCSVDTVSEGLGVVRSLQDAPYDVLLIDLQMPGLSGIEAARQLRSTLPEDRQPYIIAVTGSAPEGKGWELPSALDDVLLKPLRLERLRDALSKAVNARTGGAGRAVAAVPTPSDGSAVLDTHVVDDLTSLSRDSDPGLVDRLVESYNRSAEDLIVEIDRAVDTGDLDLLAPAVHALGGNSAALGAIALPALCEEIERCAGITDAVRALVYDLRVAHRQFLGDLTTYVGAKPD